MNFKLLWKEASFQGNHQSSLHGIAKRAGKVLADHEWVAISKDSIINDWQHAGMPARFEELDFTQKPLTAGLAGKSLKHRQGKH